MRVRTLWSLFFIVFTIIFFQILTSGMLNAQEPGSNKIIKKAGVTNIGLSLERLPGLGPDYAALALSNRENMVTGCINHSDYSHEVSYDSIYLNVTLEEYEVDTENLPLHPHYECNARPQNQKAEIVLNLEQLEKNGTQLVKITSGPAIEYFDLTLTEHEIGLAPSESHKAIYNYFKPKKVYGRKDTLHLWRYPENTLILYMPGQSSSTPETVKNAIYSVAEKHGMTPLHEIIPHFHSPLTRTDHYYFVDTEGKIADEINDQGGAFLDNARIKTISYQLEGDIETLKDAPVYAKKPGINE